MSHLSDAHIKFGNFELRYSNGWQYGQQFETLEGRSPHRFYVDPFRVLNQCIHVTRSDDTDCVSGDVIQNKVDEKHHVFRKYTSQKDFDKDKGSAAWLKEFEAHPEKYGFTHTSNRTATNPDSISEVIMNETGKAGFKYTVEHENGHWKCNCHHYQNNPTSCCKHINACLDYHCLEVSMVPRECQYKPKWSAYTTTYIINGCLLNRTPQKMIFPGFTDIVIDLAEEETECERPRKKRKTI